MLVDEGKKPDEIEAMVNNKIDNFPDYFFFELTKIGMSVLDIAKKMNTTPAEVEKRLTRYTELATMFNPLKTKLDAKIKAAAKRDVANIG